jgi:hypothetical protein
VDLPVPAILPTNTATPNPPTPPPAPVAGSNSDAASMATLDNHLTSLLDTLANQALHNMFDDNATSEILANLFNNNIENLSYDASANAFTFDTFISGRP